MAKYGDVTFGETIADRYDRHLVPLLFQPYANYLASQARTFQPQNVIEVAAGTGILTKALAAALPAEVRITATDISLPMIERGRSNLRGKPVEWHQADAMHLPFPNEAFDLGICQFGHMFFSDKKSSFLEAARVLEAGGHYIFAVWNDWKKMPEAPLTVAAEVVASLLSCDPASLVNPAYCDETTIRQDLAAARFQDIDISRVSLPATSTSAREAAVALVQGSLIRAVVEGQSPDRLDEATVVVEKALQAKYGMGVVVGQTDALIFTATKACQ